MDYSARIRRIERAIESIPVTQSIYFFDSEQEFNIAVEVGTVKDDDLCFVYDFGDEVLES